MRPEYWIGGAVIGFLLLAFAMKNHQSTTTPPAPTTADAHLICQQFVLKRLKSPSTAAFPDLTDVKAFREEGHFTVISYVDSQNVFGAQIRTRYTCSVEPAGGDQWRLLSLDL